MSIQSEDKRGKSTKKLFFREIFGVGSFSAPFSVL